MNGRTLRRLVLMSAALGASLAGGCASREPLASEATFPVDPGRYTEAFDASREAIVGLRFQLERVDAQAGVISSRPKETAGIATPWDSEQSGLDQEWEDLVQNHERRVRITFEPAAGAEPATADLTQATTPLVGRVQVMVDRVNRPGRRIETTAIAMSTTTLDPALASRGLWPRYEVPYTEDRRLALWLSNRIRRDMGLDVPEATRRPVPVQPVLPGPVRSRSAAEFE